MVSSTRLYMGQAFVLVFLLCCYVSEYDAVVCSVVFHWRETGEARISGKRNWSIMEKEIKGNRPNLSKFINTNTTFGFSTVGDCCWEVYPEISFQGEPQPLITKLPNGFGGIPGFPRLKANSLKKSKGKKVPCQ